MAFDRLKHAPYLLTSILQGLRLYPAQHPQIQQQLESSCSELQALIQEQGSLTFGLIDGTLLINEIPSLEPVPALREFTRDLERRQLQRVELLPEIDSRQLLIFCQQLSQVDAESFPERLAELGVTAIKVNSRTTETGVAATYNQALGAIEEICQDVRLGHIPASHQATSSAKGMVKAILDDPYAMLAMTMLKDYDHYTFTHSVNVAVLALAVGRACDVSAQELYELALGGLLHDLGKVTIDHQIVAKPGKLNRSEIEEMKLHPSNGARIVSGMEQIPPAVIDIVTNHHLRYDRTGYPANNRGQHMTSLADMVCIADTYDALTTTRCYQRPRSPRQAIERMKFLSGSQLHPEYVGKFLSYLGPYPVGTLVRLRNGSIGLVSDQNRQQTGSLTLKIIFGTAGERNPAPPVIELPDSRRIVAEVDPTLKGVKLHDYLP